MTTQLPDGYYNISKLFPHVARVLISRIGCDPNLLSVDPEGQTWGELLDGMTLYFIERLIFKDEIFSSGLLKNHINSDFGKIALWRDGLLGEFLDDGSLNAGDGLLPAHIEDFLYKADLWDAPKWLKNDINTSDMWSYCKNNLRCSSFIDPITWVVRNSPVPDLSSFESYQSFFPINRDQWEFEDILETWRRVKPYSGAMLVYEGKLPIEVAEKAQNLFHFYLSTGVFPKANADTYRHTLEVCLLRYNRLPTHLKKGFFRETFEEWVTGKHGETPDNSLARYYSDFRSMLPDEDRMFLKKPGPRKSIGK